MKLRLKPDKDGWFFFLNGERLGALPSPASSFYVWDYPGFRKSWDKLVAWVMRCG